MTNAPSIPQVYQTRNNDTSDIAGIFSGTLLFSLVRNLSEDLWYKSWLVILAPAATVILASLWRMAVRHYYKHSHQKGYEEATNSLRTAIDARLANPDLNQKLKDLLLKEQTDLELQHIIMLSKRVKDSRQNI